ncbi:MAG TPA: alpha/beta hydrolase [Ktedonobacteraceae bacterium]
MQQSAFDSTSIQRDISHAEKPGFTPQMEDSALDLSRRLDIFRRTHPYKEIQVEGRRWRYVVGGQGEQTLLLLPGGTLVPDTYFMLLEALEHDYRVIVPAYAAVPTMAELVTGAAAILDAEGVERVDVMGSSFGGYVAQCFVRAHPDRVDRLILAVTGVRHFVSQAAPLYLLAQVMKLLPVGAVRFFMWRLWSKLVTTSPEQQAFWLGLLQEILTTQLNKADLVSVTEEIYDFAAHYHFRSGDLAAWPGKILLLQPDQDEAYSPAIRAETRAVYPQARVHTFHDAGHTAIMTATDEFIRIIREFLAEG